MAYDERLDWTRAKLVRRMVGSIAVQQPGLAYVFIAPARGVFTPRIRRRRRATRKCVAATRAGRMKSRTQKNAAMA
jgi:hypothetical protein